MQGRVTVLPGTSQCVSEEIGNWEESMAAALEANLKLQFYVDRNIICSILNM